MEENYKINALNKLFTKLVIPTVNKVSDDTGVEIKSIEVVREYGYDEKHYEIKVEVSFRDHIESYYYIHEMFDGISHIILNAFEYMGDGHILSINLYDFKTKRIIDSWSMVLSGDRITNSEALNLIYPNGL
jgi:hypothetical protein